MTKRAQPFDPANYLDSPEAIRAFLDEAIETGDAAYFARAIGIVARSRGMTQIARETGLDRNQLYKTFSEQGNPTMKSLLAVLDSLGLKLKVEPNHHTPA